jgi:DNA-binding NtrC family response regulator
MTSEVTPNEHEGHVFVIDDEEDQRVLLAMTLERAGYRVTSLASPMMRSIFSSPRTSTSS